jgi:DNA helicase-2/ATP-dependent DNA helicase PcrA
MAERVERLVGGRLDGGFVGTFHRWALVLLRRHGDRVGLPRDFAILDGDDQRTIVAQAMAAEGVPESSFPPRTVLAAISAAKNQLLTPDAYAREAQDFFRERVARVYRRYQSLVAQASGVDFDDMLMLSVRLLD